MYKIKSDSEKNRLHITLLGFISVNEAATINEAIVKETAQLKPGFDVINDISNFKIAQEQASPILKDIMRFLISHKVNKIVRVVGASESGLIQFANHTFGEPAYNVKYVPTLQDAEIYLNAK